MFYSIDRMIYKVPDSIVQNGNTAKILALIQVARAMDIVELCKRGDYNQPNARYPQTNLNVSSMNYLV